MNDVKHCLQCNKELNINKKANFCNQSCYQKYKYNLRKPIRQCIYCKHVINGSGYKYCTTQHRKFFERLIRARLKVKRLVKNMNRARKGYHKEYKRLWGLKNHAKVLEYNHRSYYKHREKILLAQKLRYQKNREVIIKKNQQRRQRQRLLVLAGTNNLEKL